MDLSIIVITVSAVAVAAVVALIAVILNGAAERSRIVKEYEDAEDELQNRITVLTGEKAALESRLEARKEFEAQHGRDLENLKDAFKALSADNSAEFRRQSAESITELLKPVQEKFAEFGKAVQESRDESIKESARLKEHIDGIMERSKAVGDEAKNLADALTGYSKVQGDFGEMLLTGILRNAGLTEGTHFVTQSVITDGSGHEIKSGEGKTMIPDVMVLYPDDTIVIIDSKVSLKAFKEYVNAETVADRKKWAKAHAKSVRDHVDELKTKDYASYIPAGRRKVNYNLMFIPMEGAFRLMLEEDPLLWQTAKDNNVLIVSQMTLIIVLNMIQMAWKQADQEKNIADVYRTAEELMGQLKGWIDSYVAVGSLLDKAQEAYRTSTDKLSGNNQSVLKKIRKLENLGLAPKKPKGKISTSARRKGAESIIPAALSPEDKEPAETGTEDD